MAAAAHQRVLGRYVKVTVALDVPPVVVVTKTGPVPADEDRTDPVMHVISVAETRTNESQSTPFKVTETTSPSIVNMPVMLTGTSPDAWQYVGSMARTVGAVRPRHPQERAWGRRTARRVQGR